MAASTKLNRIEKLTRNQSEMRNETSVSAHAFKTNVFSFPFNYVDYGFVNGIATIAVSAVSVQSTR